MLLLALTLAASAATVTITFGYDFGSPRWRQCAADSATTNCLDHFEAGILNGTTLTSLVLIPFPGGSTAPSGVVNGITGTFVTNQPGTQTIAVIMVQKDATGARVTSDPTKASVVILNDKAPAPPTGLTAIVQ